MQYQTLPVERTKLDLQLLRASSLHSGDDLLGQVTDSSDMVSGLSLNMSNTLDKLEEECELPNYRALQKWSKQEFAARASAVKSILNLYREQSRHDYQLLRSTKEKNIIVLAQLANKQAIENLVLNSRILKMAQEKDIQVRDRIKDAMATITESTIGRLESQ